MAVARTIYTIGYSCHTPASLAAVLAQHGITALADVRSQPYSRYKPEFNKEALGEFLQARGTAYVFLGELCGARIDAPECYVDGKADFARIARHPKFVEGLQRILKGAERYTLALMCAEKDPITCHRTILICRNLREAAVNIRHLLCDGTIEEHRQAERRLMKVFDLDQPDMFLDEAQRLAQAYERQATKIAYVEELEEPDADERGET